MTEHNEGVARLRELRQLRPGSWAQSVAARNLFPLALDVIEAAEAAVDEWDAATKDWLEWFARGGKGFHEFPIAAANRLRSALEAFRTAATQEATR